jgi:hypothetical protein
VNLCKSPSVVMMVKSKRLRWTQITVRVGDTRNIYKVLVEKSLKNGTCRNEIEMEGLHQTDLSW